MMRVSMLNLLVHLLVHLLLVLLLLNLLVHLLVLMHACIYDAANFVTHARTNKAILGVGFGAPIS